MDITAISGQLSVGGARPTSGAREKPEPTSMGGAKVVRPERRAPGRHQSELQKKSLHAWPVARFVLDGPMNGEAFLVYVEEVLAPSLSPGDLVVIDNLPAHKIEGVRKRFEATGARLLYLPPCAPDLNPIELALAKLKALLRKAARTNQRGSRGQDQPAP